ncbi:N-acetylmuramoyl-L-alanine amidase [Alkalibacterium subtropicum]|uniref:N-acetylmuramoyl-L-alanine amidase n=1 Tax=Alkalibacterium subtropicum TaxID=753702 RepID=A0A1I1GEL9_9LACT|nr:N-acetylmuramoyl-L-alanine amidase [Alkalibacterium subtropicum]SFC10189.1 N-acetylmuramoyl-L-alanine amidase [Alkalibacterium subtropicum]
MSKSIILDAGHGGSDPGASGFGVLEKDWNLKITLYQYKRLKELGADVHLTRDRDLTLEHVQRVARIKNQYAVCVSNHWNAFNGQARGIEVIHSVHAKPAFAEDLAERLVKATQLPLRRVFSRTMKPGVDYYYMQRLTGKTETVIIEYGFIDNVTDHQAYLKTEVFYAAAEAVIESLCQKIGVAYSSPEVTGSSKVENEIQVKKYSGKRLVSHHDGQLRFYTKPSWEDKDVFGYVTKGQGFPTVLEKVSVGRGTQYKVKNSKGKMFFITASPVYVSVS